MHRTINLMPSESPICNGLIFSDQVIKDAGTGKISLINCFTALNAPAIPFLAPPFFVTALISGFTAKGKTIRFKVSIKKRDSEGYILDVDGQAVAQGTGDPDDVGEMVWAIPSLSFPEVGVYDLTFAINGAEIGKRSLLVKSMTGAQVVLEMTSIETQFILGRTVSGGTMFISVQRDSGPNGRWSAIAQVVRQIVDNAAVFKIKRDRLSEIRAHPFRTLEEIDRHLQQKAAEVVDAWKNQPAISLPSALDQIRRNRKR